MNLREYANSERFNLQERKEIFNNDPVKVIMENDDLPYDEIMMYEGKLQKVVHVDDGRVISIVDLLSYMKVTDISEKDIPLREVYGAYMDNVSVNDPTFKQIQELLQRARK